MDAREKGNGEERKAALMKGCSGRGLGGGRRREGWEHPDMMSASEGGYGKADVVREVAGIL